MQTNPLFSVVIPAHNQKDRLDATLASIAACEFDLGKVEVIVVDDGSKDGTYETFESRSYPFDFRIERVHHSSQSKTTNEAIRLARGTYVLSSAQDILFDPAMFRKHLAAHERSPDRDVVVLGNLPYPTDMDVTPFMFYLVNGGYQFAYFLIRDRFDVPPNFLYAPNFSVKRDVFERVGLFDEEFPYGCQDTDLGFRFVENGVRIVYEPEAIGYHNHPVDLEGYCKRQVAIGGSMLPLQRKHPDYEGGPGFQDLAVEQYLMVPDTRLDQAHRVVERLEPLLAQSKHASYQALWARTFCKSDASMTTLAPEESETFHIVQELFKAYHLILGHHWGRGFLQTSIETEGRERVARWLRCRLNKAQASVQVRRNIRTRLAEHGIEWEAPGAADYRVTQIVPDLPDYETAIRFLEPFQNPPAGRCNYQLILVLDEDRFSTEERARLEAIAEVVVDRDEDRGVRTALQACASEVAMITSSRIEPIRAEHEFLVDRLFERIPALSVLSGGLVIPDEQQIFCGHRADGAPLVSTPAADEGMVAVDAPIREFCCLRGSAIRQWLDAPVKKEEENDDCESWNQQLGRTLRDGGLQVWHVPDLQVHLNLVTEAQPVGAGA